MTISSLRTHALPGPRLLPIIGSFNTTVMFLREPVLNMFQLYKTYGPIVSLPLFNMPSILTFTPEYNRVILSDPNNFYVNDSRTGTPFIPADSAWARVSMGLTAMNGEIHNQRRKLMLPAFHKKRIEAYRDTMIDCTERHLHQWRVGEVRNMLNEVQQIAMRIAMEALLGLDPEHDGRITQQHIEMWLHLAASPGLLLFPFNLPGLPRRQIMRISELIEQDIRAIIARKRSNCTADQDVLAMLIAARDEDGRGLSDEELVGQTLMLIAAGHATTAHTMAWVLLMLEQHPRVLADLLDELDKVVQGGVPTLEQLPQLTLLDAVIKETLRLFPPILWLARTSMRSFELGPYSLPAGVRLFFSPAITHRLPEIYAQPDRFLPERWTNFTPGPYEYIPFGGGPRRCIGAEFALMELKLVLPLILQRYRLSIPHGTRLKRGGAFFSAPRPGLPMQINAQDHRFVKSDLRGEIHRSVDLG